MMCLWDHGDTSDRFLPEDIWSQTIIVAHWADQTAQSPADVIGAWYGARE